MSTPEIPDQAILIRLWQREKLKQSLFPVASMLVGLQAALLVLMIVVSSEYFSVWWFLGAVFSLWLGAFGYLVFVKYRQPPASVLAKRADRALGLPDSLLGLSEMEAYSAWRRASESRVREQFKEERPGDHWVSPKLGRRNFLTSMAAVVLALAVLALGRSHLYQEAKRLAVQQQEKAERLAAAEEVLLDWEEFAKLTDDEELKKFFAEAGELRRALEEKSTMDVMLEMNRLEEQMASLQQAISQNSMASQAAAMAEALEAFEGMGAMSAALRNQSFDAAAAEAEKLTEALKRTPEKNSELRREEAVAEMLASEANAVSQRGNARLSEALSQLSQVASRAGKKGSVPNRELLPPVQGLCEAFCEESAKKNRGRALAMSQKQLDELRRRLRGDCDGMALMPSLCQGMGQSSSLQAGTSSGGDPLGEQTELAQTERVESGVAISGDGESETRTLRSNTGSGNTSSATQPASFADYVELSQRAVADENLPLAHRRVIRTYFERIRPIAEHANP